MSQSNEIINLGGEDGTITLSAKSKLTVKVGDNITLVLDGQTGTVRLQAKSIAVETQNAASLKTDGTAKLAAAQVDVQANSMLKLGSGGIVDVSGTPIKLG